MRRLSVLIVFFLSFLTPSFATTWYVGKTGSDSNNCSATVPTARDSSTPKLTIAAALNCIGNAAGAGAGHTVQVAVGTYDERFGNLPSGTSWGSPFTLKAKPGDTVTIKPSSILAGIPTFDLSSGSYTIIEGFVVDGTNGDETQFNLWGVNFIRLLNLQIVNTRRKNGVFLSTEGGHHEIIGGSIHDGTFIGTNPGNKAYAIYCAGNDNLIDGVEIYNIQGYGIHMYDSNVNPTNNTIRNCNIYNTVLDTNLAWMAGILLTGNGNIAYNNIVRNSVGHGVQVGAIGRPTTNNKIYNNTIYQNSQSGINIKTATSSTGIINNIIYLNGTGSIINECGAGCVTTTANLTTNPSFVNAGTNDFHLAAGSLAIDNGVASPPNTIFTTDLEGNSRPQGLGWDIGAYEKTTAAGDTLTLLSPNGGTLGVVSSPQTITWGSTGTIANVKLSYDAANDGVFETVISASTANDGSFDFTASATPTTTGRFKVEDAADGSPSDVSDANVTITAAAGGATTAIISDNTTGTKIGTISGTSDTFLWNVNPTLNYGTDFSIQPNKVSAADHSHVLLRFDGLSQIPPTATITSVILGLYLVDGGTATAETFDVRRLLVNFSETQATWNSYSTGNAWSTAGGLGAATDRVDAASAQITGVTLTGGFYTVTSTSGTGTLFDDVQKIVNGTYSNYGWHIERNGTGNDGAYRVFGSKTETNGQRPYLEVAYTVGTATITATQPNGSSHFFPGQDMPLRWTSEGLSGNLKAEISYNNGVYYQPTPIVASIPYNQPDGIWTVTGPACTQCKIKYTSLTDPSVFAETPAFKIAGTQLGIQ